MKVLTSEQMRAAEEVAGRDLGIPPLLLMENAAIGVVDALGERFSEARSPLVVCGPGNNGGDGLAAARHLAARGYAPRVLLATGGRAMGGDAATQLEIVRRMNLPLTETAGAEAWRGADLVVDALFGTGLSRPLEGFFAELVTRLDDLPLPRVAVDLPSGLDASSARLDGPSLRADLAVALGAPKVAHALPPACDRFTDLVIADLGLPRHLFEAQSTLEWPRPEEMAAFLAPRPRGGHKGTFGHVLVVGGSPGLRGAPALAALGAIRAGAGLVTAAVPALLTSSLHAAVVEAMSLALPSSEPDGLDPQAVERVLEAAAGKGVVVLGPGLGSAPGSAAAGREIALRLALPLVLDADGLNAFAGRAVELSRRRAPTVLTPHPGELARLLGRTVADIEADRLVAVRAAAVTTAAVVVLKGRATLVAEPGGEVSINPTGNPGLATGGTGDVLAGCIGALVAQGYEVFAAAQLGVYLHGLAADLLAADRGEAGLSARDVADALPRAAAALRASL
jgi:NAD(P)H-hydrate epimerase